MPAERRPAAGPEQHGYRPAPSPAGTGYRNAYDTSYQSGALPPASPSHAGNGNGHASPYSPPAPRRPDTVEPEGTLPAAVPERPAPAYPSTAHGSSGISSAAAMVSDLDDDVDVPPFMRR